MYYRPYAGTVVLVVSGGGSDKTSNNILGLNYLSYHTQSLAVSCPDYFLGQTPGGEDLINKINPPTLPIIFGTFGDGSLYDKTTDVRFSNKSNICPSSYTGSLITEYGPAESEIPVAQGCLLRVRDSKCRLGYNVIFFTIVTVALAIKALLLVTALMVVQERPILTVGDAIAEYLENEDLSTVGCSLEWTRARGLQCIGPVETYPFEGQDIGKSEGHSGAPVEKSQKRCWREIWPSKGDARQAAVPKWDIINYSAAMRSWERVLWLIHHVFTMAVSAGIFTSIFQQSGWKVLPTNKRYVETQGNSRSFY
jgi:hypothetical protein